MLGASGYAGGELLRWIAAHPRLRLAGAGSRSHAGRRIGEVFPHLAPAFRDTRFTAARDLGDAVRAAASEHLGVALFSATPHTWSAPAIEVVLEAAAGVGADPAVVDLSADFRHGEPSRFEEIYRTPHPTPELVAGFHCGLPEIDRRGAGVPAGAHRFAHPGCFATAAALAAAPLALAGLLGPDLHVAGITGSTGSGALPKPTTHHPVRHANLYAYKPLSHRHAPEMEDLLTFPGRAPVRVRFAPHSGPFARGIHITAFATPPAGSGPLTNEALAGLYRDFYAGSPLVRAALPVRLKDIVGTAGAVTGAVTDGEIVTAFAAIDNLGKGAASGAMQWMNIALGLPEATGLTAPAAGWL